MSSSTSLTFLGPVTFLGRAPFLTIWYQSEQQMEESFKSIFKLTGSNYLVWKSKMSDMLVVKDLWLPM